MESAISVILIFGCYCYASLYKGNPLILKDLKLNYLILKDGVEFNDLRVKGIVNLIELRYIKDNSIKYLSYSIKNSFLNYLGAEIADLCFDDNRKILYILIGTQGDKFFWIRAIDLNKTLMESDAVEYSYDEGIISKAKYNITRKKLDENMLIFFPEKMSIPVVRMVNLSILNDAELCVTITNPVEYQKFIYNLEKNKWTAEEEVYFPTPKEISSDLLMPAEKKQSLLPPLNLKAVEEAYKK